MSLLDSLRIINAFHVQWDDEDFNDFLHRIDSEMSPEVIAAYDALRLAGYDVVASGSNRRTYKLDRVDPVIALADDDDSVEVCQTASSGKENNKRSKITKATAKKTARVGGGNKLALQTEMYKDSEDPSVRELSMKMASTERQLLELQTLFKRELIFYITTLFTLVITLTYYILYFHSYRG